jgi:hypothetical protein
LRAGPSAGRRYASIPCPASHCGSGRCSAYPRVLLALRPCWHAHGMRICMCMCMHRCTMHMRVRTCTCTCTYAHAHMHMHICIHICICMDMLPVAGLPCKGARPTAFTVRAALRSLRVLLPLARRRRRRRGWRECGRGGASAHEPLRVDRLLSRREGAAEALLVGQG